MTDYSVIITHYNRESNLRNTLHGLARQTIVPKEILVVDMGNGIGNFDDVPCAVKILDYERAWRFLPLASARNFGAQWSDTERLVFLDVDCIPARDFGKKITNALNDCNGLIMGSPKYMLRPAAPTMDQHGLEQNSVSHPSRPKIDGLREENCYELFWSLCFSIFRNTFLELGGFDEGYKGYGAEDTDFALKLKAARIPFFLSDAEVYHQQHPIYVPPLNHLEAITNNCNHFFGKWGYWPMVDCLTEFSDGGFIDWTPDSEQAIRLLKRPSEHQVKKRLVKNAPYR